MGKEDPSERYGAVADLIIESRVLSNLDSYEDNAKKLWKALQVDDWCGNVVYSIAKLDAILIGIFERYYDKISTRSDRYEMYTRVLVGLGLLDGYYHHFLSPNGELEEFYSTEARAYHFLQDKDELERISKNQIDGSSSQGMDENSTKKRYVSAKELTTFKGYCGNKGKLAKFIDYALTRYKTTEAKNKFFQACINENIVNGKLKLPHYPDLLDKSKRGDPSSANANRNRPGPPPDVKKGASQNNWLNVRFNVKKRPDCCIGRDGLLDKIRNEFTQSGRIQILYGTLGVGKSTAAKEYAFRYREDYQFVWWINADSSKDLTDNCKAFLSGHGIPKDTLQDPNTDIGLLFREYFYGINGNWLLIFDNADYLDNSDENDNNQTQLVSCLPENTVNGHILITSRCNVDFMAAKRHRLDAFTEEHALEFLQSLTGQKPDEAAKAVAKKLGFLPLALRYAGAYMKSLKESYSDYLELWNEYGPKVLDEKLEEVTDYHDTVRIAFHITLDKLFARQSPKREVISAAVLQFLNICSYTAPDNINLIPYMDAAKYLPEHLPEQLGNVLKDRLNSKIFERELIRYSLFERTGERTYSIHRLLQEIIRDEHTKDSKNPTEDEIKEIIQWINCSRLSLGLQKTVVEYGGRTPEKESLILSLIPHARTVLRWYARFVHNEEELEKLCFEYARWSDDLTLEDMRNQSLMNEKEMTSFSDLLNFLHSVPKQTYLTPVYHDQMGQRYRNIGKVERAAEEFSAAIQFAAAIFDECLNSPISNLDQVDAIFMTALAYHDAVRQCSQMDGATAPSDMEYYAGKLLCIAEKIIKEADKLDWSKEYPGQLVIYIRAMLIWAYEIKIPASDISENLSAEEIKALGETMLENEDLDSMRMVISNVVNYVVGHYSEMDATEERIGQWRKNLTEGWQQKLDSAVQSIESQVLEIGNHNYETN